MSPNKCLQPTAFVAGAPSASAEAKRYAAKDTYGGTDKNYANRR